MATPSTVPAPITNDASGSGRTVEIAVASAQEHEHHHALDAIPGKRASSSEAGDHDQAASGSGAGGGKLHVSRDLNAYRELPGLVSHFFSSVFAIYVCTYAPSHLERHKPASNILIIIYHRSATAAANSTLPAPGLTTPPSPAVRAACASHAPNAAGARQGV
jgi:hypothetical protein